LLGQRVTALKGLQQFWRETHTPNGPFGPEQPGASSPIERRATTLDPLFDPTGFGVRRVAVPDTREQRHNGTGFRYDGIWGTPRIQRRLGPR